MSKKLKTRRPRKGSNTSLQGEKNSVKELLQKTEKLIFRNYLSAKGRFSSGIIENPFEVIYVPVEMINYEVNDRFMSGLVDRKSFAFRQSPRGIILNYNWSSSQKEIIDTYKFIAFRERFIEGKEWEETAYYNIFLHKKGSRRIRNNKNWTQFKDTHLIKWDGIYQDIQKNGFKSEAERRNMPEFDVSVCVSQGGEIMKSPGGGRHRVAIAKLLKIKEIPVVVSIWHKDYIDWVKKEYGLKRLTPQEAIEPILAGKINKKKKTLQNGKVNE